MKNKLPYIIALVFALLALIFAGLWVHEKNKKTELTELLCENSIKESFEHFTAYKMEEADEEYWYGVADYNAFMKSYILLCDGENQSDRIEMNRAYGSMVIAPNDVKSNMDKLLEALELLSNDIYDSSAIIKLTEFNNALEHK